VMEGHRPEPLPDGVRQEVADILAQEGGKE
jgi:hypothetical protein